MPDSVSVYVVTEQFFEKEFPRAFKHLDRFRGFLAKRSFGNQNYYVLCTIDSPSGPVVMNVVSEHAQTDMTERVLELMTRINDNETRAAIKMNPSGVLYSHCSQDILDYQISEKNLFLMYSECLRLLMSFEDQFEKAVMGDDLLLRVKPTKSGFPFQPSDLGDYLDGAVPELRDANDSFPEIKRDTLI